MLTLGREHNPKELRPFIDASKLSLTAVLFHIGNVYPTIPIGYAILGFLTSWSFHHYFDLAFLLFIIGLQSLNFLIIASLSYSSMCPNYLCAFMRFIMFFSFSFWSISWFRMVLYSSSLSHILFVPSTFLDTIRSNIRRFCSSLFD